MTRRSLMTAIAAALAGATTARASSPRPRYGAVDVTRHRILCAYGIHLHVIDRAGVDITDRCRFADDTGEGIAELFRLDANGRKYLDPETRRPAIEIVRGIRLEEGRPITRG